MLCKATLVSRSVGRFAFAGLVACVPEGSLSAASADHLPKIKKENRKSVAKADLKAKGAATVSRSAENVVVHSGGVGRALNAAVNDGALGRRPVFDTPFSVVSVGAAAIQARQATDIKAVVAQDSSVTTANSGSGYSDQVIWS